MPTKMGLFTLLFTIYINYKIYLKIPFAGRQRRVKVLHGRQLLLRAVERRDEELHGEGGEGQKGRTQELKVKADKVRGADRGLEGLAGSRVVLRA